MDWTWQSVRGKNTLSQFICKVRDEALAQSITPSKEIQDSLGFWIPHCWFRIPGTGFRILCQWNFDSGFQSLVRLQIPRSKVQNSGFHNSKISWIQRLAFSLQADVLRASSRVPLAFWRAKRTSAWEARIEPKIPQAKISRILDSAPWGEKRVRPGRLAFDSRSYQTTTATTTGTSKKQEVKWAKQQLCMCFVYSHLAVPSPRSEFLEKATGLSVRLSLGFRGEGAGSSGRPTRLEI